jgi:hypothetical protein
MIEQILKQIKEYQPTYTFKKSDRTPEQVAYLVSKAEFKRIRKAQRRVENSGT